MKLYRVKVELEVWAEDADKAQELVFSDLEYLNDVSSDDGHLKHYELQVEDELFPDEEDEQ